MRTTQEYLRSAQSYLKGYGFFIMFGVELKVEVRQRCASVRQGQSTRKTAKSVARFLKK